LLFRSYGYTIEEIARAQGVAVATVKKQIQKGLKRLPDLLDPEVELFGLSVVLILLLR
jgi:DNA-directed RNA polymerase specialized sigma24 family protein